jgi:hypothetical protein
VGSAVSHLTEEELILHHFAEGEGATSEAAHLAECPACREELDALRRDLGAVSLPEPPERGPDYGSQVWARIRPQIQPRLRPRPFVSRAWAPLAMAASLVIAFLLGRHSAPDAAAPVTTAARERILLVAVGDHLERSAMLLVELANAGDDGKPVDISAEQEWAQELVGENRLYRQTVVRSGEPGVASLLDELERVLVEVAHRPSSVSPAELREIRGRIESRGLLFRVRVIESQVREKEKEATKAQGQSSGTKVVS